MNINPIYLLEVMNASSLGYYLDKAVQTGALTRTQANHLIDDIYNRYGGRLPPEALEEVETNLKHAINVTQQARNESAANKIVQSVRNIESKSNIARANQNQHIAKLYSQIEAISKLPTEELRKKNEIHWIKKVNKLVAKGELPAKEAEAIIERAQKDFLSGYAYQRLSKRPNIDIFGSKSGSIADSAKKQVELAKHNAGAHMPEVAPKALDQHIIANTAKTKAALANSSRNSKGVMKTILNWGKKLAPKLVK